MKKHTLIALAATFLILAACTTLSPEQRAVFQDLLERGMITQEQFETLTGGQAIPTWVEIGLSVIGSLIGVRLLRGPAMKQIPALVAKLQNGEASTTVTATAKPAS